MQGLWGNGIFPGTETTIERDREIFKVYQAFDPQFPGNIRCGRCGKTFPYDADDIHEVGATGK